MIYLRSIYSNTIKEKLFQMVIRYERYFAYARYNKQNELHAVNHPSVRFGKNDYSWNYNGRHHRYYGPAVNWLSEETKFAHGGYTTVRWILHGIVIK